MPFGPKCEYPDFGACLKANKGKDNPGAYCATIKDKTEDHCKHKSAPVRSAAAMRATRSSSAGGSMRVSRGGRMTAMRWIGGRSR